MSNYPLISLSKLVKSFFIFICVVSTSLIIIALMLVDQEIASVFTSLNYAVKQVASTRGDVFKRFMST
jgi:hypothetical protein